MLSIIIPLITLSQPAISPDLAAHYQPSFAKFGAITESGSLKGVYGGRSVSWSVGDRPEDLFTLGDIDQLGPGDLTLNTIKDQTGIPFDGLTLKDFPLLADSNLEDVADAVGNDPQFLGTLLINEGRTVGEVIEDGDGKKKTLAQSLGIEKPLEDIAAIQDAVIKKLTNYKNAAISAIPGLPQLPFASYPAQLANNSLAGISLFAKPDLILDKAEQGIDNTISGSEKEKTRFQTPCPPLSPCGHVEMRDLISLGMAGKRWINGKHQKVRGGKGTLGAVFDNKEPTGRLPFGPGSPFKLVLTGTDESTDKASFSAYFQYCYALAGCTGYNIGPFPLYSAGLRDWVWLGVNPTEFGKIPIGFDPAVGQGADLSSADLGTGFSVPNPSRPKGRGKEGDCHTGKNGLPNYIWPTQGPITSGFSGSRNHPILGVRQGHRAIDIGAPTGSPIVAEEGGTIVYAGWNKFGYGYVVELKDACKGFVWRHAHMSKMYVKAGQTVKQGQQLGEVGSTGLSTGPHLHLETLIGGPWGTKVNPLIYLSRR